MTVKAASVLALLKELGEQAGAPINYGGFKTMEEFLELDQVTQRYLDDIHRNAQRALDQEQVYVGTHRPRLDQIAVALKLGSFFHFEQKIGQPADPVLINCVGRWWSIVRGNTGDHLFKAPVQVKKNQDNQVMMTLQGQSNKFSGKMTARAGSIFCELDSEKEKRLLLVLKGNVNPSATVLQGIFSGISSTGDPIGGRELLVRETELPYSDMKWSSIPVTHEQLDPRIRRYFATTEGNCIKIDNTIDLG